MKTLTNILLITTLLLSCRGKESQLDDYSIKENTLLYQVIDSLLLPDSSYRKHFLIHPISFPSDSARITQNIADKLNHIRDSLIQVLDTACFYIAFDDTLKKFSSYIKSERFEKLKMNKAFYHLENVDISFFTLFDKITEDTTPLNERSIDVNGFKTQYKYIIIPSDSIQIIKDRGFRVIETHSLSRVIFNDTYTQACFCDAEYSLSTAGVGYLVLVEKRNQKWIIVKKVLLWES